jgi:hypothetical protein
MFKLHSPSSYFYSNSQWRNFLYPYGQNVAYRHLVQTNETINIDMSVYILLKGQFTSSILVLSFLF